MRVIRLSIPGNACIHCGTIITEKLKCSGCGHIDPVTVRVGSVLASIVNPKYFKRRTY